MQVHMPRQSGMGEMDEERKEAPDDNVNQVDLRIDLRKEIDI